MSIPESIERLTESKTNDIFIVPQKKEDVNMDEIIFNIKQKIKPAYLKFFEEGAGYYIAGSTERSIIKGVISLYIDVVVKQLRKQNIDDKIKQNIISNFENTTKTFIQLFDFQQTMLNSLEMNKKVIDATEISYIMLGYAIETLRKLHNAKS